MQLARPGNRGGARGAGGYNPRRGGLAPPPRRGKIMISSGSTGAKKNYCQDICDINLLALELSHLKLTPTAGVSRPDDPDSRPEFKPI